MKKQIYLLFFAILFSVISTAQTNFEKISYITEKRDTLYLLKNQVSEKILELWKTYTYPEKPIILMVSKLPVPNKKRKIKNS